MSIFSKRYIEEGQSYLTKDKEKRDEAEARLKALEVIVDIQSRRRGQSDINPHH